MEVLSFGIMLFDIWQISLSESREFLLHILSIANLSLIPCRDLVRGQVGKDLGLVPLDCLCWIFAVVLVSFFSGDEVGFGEGEMLTVLVFL